MMASVKQHEACGTHHLAVGTEVSAKYRGAFCEAQIKSVKKNVQYKVMSKKTGKCSQVSEENIRGVLKISSVVEAQFPEQQLWQECTIQNIKDRSVYTVIFDDGDERTLSRGSLCLKGDRHYAKSETLDNLPLTDPENFGTPVLTMKKNRRRRPVEDEYDDESEDQKTPDRENLKMKKEKQRESNEQESSTSESEEDDDEKRRKWLADPLMGRVVIVEPNDKRKHWFPGLVVNPLCYERHQDLSSSHLVVRSFKTGKFLRVNRSSVKEMSPATIPQKIDNVWKGIVEDAQQWQNYRIASDRWRIDIKNILSDSDDEDSCEDEGGKTRRKDNERKLEKSSEAQDGTKEKEEEKKSHDFLEVLYKFMEDRGTPINKTPVLGYKDLDLFLLFKLVQRRQGSFTIHSIKEWKQIYLDLGIPKPNPAAGYNVRTAYMKYLGFYEEYSTSWKHVPLPRKMPIMTKTVSQPSIKVKREKKVPERNTREGSKLSQENRKIKYKEKDSPKYKSVDVEGKTRGRSSPITMVDSPMLPLQRRSGQRRRASESSSASDVTATSIGKNEKKKNVKGIQLKKPDDKLRNPGGPDSEPDETLRSTKMEKKDPSDKKQSPKSIGDLVLSKRIRRNSTSNVLTRYFVGDKLKVKYGQGKTFKLYDAKVLQVKMPEGPGEAIEYLVHYAGWNARHDEWIKPGRIVGIAEDSVPSSPSAGSGKLAPRRPKTPITSRNTFSYKEDITPSPILSISFTNPFPYVAEDVPHLKDDLPQLIVKPRIPSTLKKNLVGEFAKSFPGATFEVPLSKCDTERPASPILVSSQRNKRPKSPQIVESPPASVKEEPIIKKEALPIENEVSEIKMGTDLIKVDVNVKTEAKNGDESGNKVEESIEVINKPDDSETKAAISIKEERERSVSPSEDSTSSSPGEASEDNSNGARSSTPPIPVRRTPRRSKSPAYLDLYAPTKRRKPNSTTVKKSPSPAPQSVEEKIAGDAKQHIIDNRTSAKVERLPSPTLSLSSSNSSSSSEDNNTEAKNMSPVLTTGTAKPTKPKVTRPRKKTQIKVEEIAKEEINLKTEEEETVQMEKSKTTEYDNFDEEAPSIALEKHHEHEPNIEESTEDDQNISGNDDEQASMEISSDITDVKQESLSTFEPTMSVVKTEEPISSSIKEDVTDDKTNEPKIKRRKSISKSSEENLWEKDSDEKTLAEQEIATAKDDVPNAEPQETIEMSELETLPSASDCQTSSSNHENLEEHQVQHEMPTAHPQNPPSSSKVLLENTPPTTPEQSPNYISEDQDIDASKTPPALDSDAMDMCEEHKDSGGNTSSSGCEHPTVSDKMTQGEPQVRKNDTHEKEDISSPPLMKKKRMRRKRTTSKSRGNRRSSYTNDQDSESEEDQDHDTGETNHRKRHESGCKPRKRRAKARPEPPSAPPPLPREELESMSQDERIALLQSRMAEMRKVYHQLKQEVANIDRKRKRAKRREREAAEMAQSSSSKRRLSSPFTPPKATSAASKVEAITEPCASPVMDGQAVIDGGTKPEDSCR